MAVISATTEGYLNPLSRITIYRLRLKRIIMMILCNIQIMYCNKFMNMEKIICSSKP